MGWDLTKKIKIKIKKVKKRRQNINEVEMYLVGWYLTKINKKFKRRRKNVRYGSDVCVPCMCTCDLGKHNLKV